MSRALFVGLCGPQGSGKSTASAFICDEMTNAGLRVALMSIDDFYLTQKDRARLAGTIHPLLSTRGPPGTHDLPLLHQTVETLMSGDSIALPRFNKGSDDRIEPRDWPWFEGPADIVLLEGWFVGAKPQPEADLLRPVNALEATRDRCGTWRRYTNSALALYQDVFGRIDYMIQLSAPDFSVVTCWRTEQERTLRQIEAVKHDRVMSDDQVSVFVMHYERLTTAMSRGSIRPVDIRISLDQSRRCTEIQYF